jgi:two-component sensor histidine kinase
MPQLSTLVARIRREGLPPESLEAYAFGAVCLAAATGLRFALHWIDGNAISFVSYFPAIVLTTLVSGFGPGMFVAIASMIVRWWISAPQIGADWDNAAFYLLCSASTVWIVHSYRITSGRLHESEGHIRLLMGELQHRRRNTLAVVQAIVTKTLQGNIADAKKINDRISAWLSADRFLTSYEAASADIRDVVKAALAPFDGQNVSLCGPPFMLAPDLVGALALIFHELATNAAKYGALSQPSASLSIFWSATDACVQIEWLERGVGSVAAPTRAGFGTFIFSRLLDKFGGRISTDFRTDGLKCEICFDSPEQEAKPSRGSVAARPRNQRSNSKRMAA